MLLSGRCVIKQIFIILHITSSFNDFIDGKTIGISESHALLPSLLYPIKLNAFIMKQKEVSMLCEGVRKKE